MKKKIKYLLLTSVLVVIVILGYMLLWGKLFPFSPIFIGFNKHELNNTVVYVQEGAGFNEFTRIDTLTKSVENFHELKFKSKPKIFIFRDSESYLQRSISKARFCSFPGGSLVISPWALKEDKQGLISLDIYLRHELSHVLIFNYKGLIGSLRYPGWLLEGIAVYSSNQMGTSFYPDKEETYKLIKAGSFMPPEYFKTKKEDEVKLNVKYKAAFIYSEFGCIVDYLIMNYGREKFIQYMKALLEENDNEVVFSKIYSKSFKTVIIDFKKSVYKS
ncbi:MAG: hypothetical protein P4L45_07735 [Ignavibacteriaceae bacterium]|nr:hypothetical protein [Ignavibacteriaceae bacterium]